MTQEELLFEMDLSNNQKLCLKMYKFLTTRKVYKESQLLEVFSKNYQKKFAKTCDLNSNV